MFQYFINNSYWIQWSLTVAALAQIRCQISELMSGFHVQNSGEWRSCSKMNNSLKTTHKCPQNQATRFLHSDMRQLSAVKYHQNWFNLKNVVLRNHNKRGSGFGDLMVLASLLPTNKKPTVLFTIAGCYGHLTMKARLSWEPLIRLKVTLAWLWSSTWKRDAPGLLRPTGDTYRV